MIASNASATARPGPEGISSLPRPLGKPRRPSARGGGRRGTRGRANGIAWRITARRSRGARASASSSWSSSRPVGQHRVGDRELADVVSGPPSRSEASRSSASAELPGHGLRDCAVTRAECPRVGVTGLDRPAQHRQHRHDAENSAPGRGSSSSAPDIKILPNGRRAAQASQAPGVLHRPQQPRGETWAESLRSGRTVVPRTETRERAVSKESGLVEDEPRPRVFGSLSGGGRQLFQPRRRRSRPEPSCTSWQRSGTDERGEVRQALGREIARRACESGTTPQPSARASESTVRKKRNGTCLFSQSPALRRARSEPGRGTLRCRSSRSAAVGLERVGQACGLKNWSSCSRLKSRASSRRRSAR